MNPVVKGLVQDSFAWPWSSARWFVERQGPVEIDQIRLPSGPKRVVQYKMILKGGRVSNTR